MKWSRSGWVLGAAAIALVASTWTGAKAAPAAGVVPATVPFGPGFYGVNDDYQNAAKFSADDVGPLLAQLEPGTLRWPGGTEADFFDWQKGKPTRKPKAYAFTLDKLAALVKATGATPVFDVNVRAPGNRLNTTDQVNMLEHAESLGIKIRYVEIGNELYGGGALEQAFPTGKAYGKTVSLYVKTLHADFPGVLVAADGCLHPMTSRQATWNSELLDTATGAGSPDAIILHDYPGATYKPFRSADIPPLLEDPYDALNELDTAAQKLDGKPVWITEYNFRGPFVPKAQRVRNPVTTTYAHELFLAEYGLLLPRVEHVSRVDNFTALGSSDFGAWIHPTTPVLSPDGQAVEMVDAAGKGATSSTPITVAGAPKLPDGEPAVTGQAFFDKGRPTSSILVNLTGHGENVPVSSEIPDGAIYERATGQPRSTLLIAKPLTQGTVAGTNLWLPRYSVTLVNSIVSQNGTATYVTHSAKLEPLRASHAGHS